MTIASQTCPLWRRVTAWPSCRDGQLHHELRRLQPPLAADDDAGNDPHQRMLNEHAREDDHHWPWFLEDFAKLGFDTHAPSSENKH